jgi:Ca2+-binding RTX toxin-like protein
MAKFIGTENDDVLRGGSGNDVLRGLGGNDDLSGRNGNDRITGNDGDDILKGDGGADRLNGGDGNDILDGGKGSDLIEPGSNVGFGDVVLGSRGNDTIDLSGGGMAYWLDYGGLAQNLKITVNKTGGTVDKGALGTDSIIGLDAFFGGGGLNLIGGRGNDIIKANVAEGLFVRMIGGEGADRFVGGDGFDQVLLRANGDIGVKVKVESYKGGMNGSAIDGWGNQDVFRRVDEVRGSVADDRLIGGSGRDNFVSYEGNDFVNGRGGAFDAIRYNQVTVQSVNIDLENRTGEIVMDAGTFTDTLRNMELISGSREGNDIIRGGDAGERLTAFAGNDVLSGRGGEDRLFGGDGNDDLRGNDGNDRLFGENGKDVLRGGDGDDTLVGGKGRDTLEGDDGADTFEFSTGDGKGNRITDMTLGEDVISIRDGAASFADLDISSNGDDAVVAFSNVRVILEDVDSTALDAGDFLFA